MSVNLGKNMIRLSISASNAYSLQLFANAPPSYPWLDGFAYRRPFTDQEIIQNGIILHPTKTPSM
ncbi:hypothetical protein [Vibrio ziniensis]|uniref:Uncharacterized protein n=1 Tax=Vibrio ziniensis TaxID=2711221 RepID=A0A6G7CJ69_9VIBR|nr:hypothetical protein [Vibrio ziniensis]QIH42093.1 hypothetical protein G5S32_08835 [Vibrio ziniensis]